MIHGVPLNFDRSELAIARSVIYASLFDYPLTLDQLHESLISASLTPKQIQSTFDNSPALQAVIGFKDGYFFPAGRSELIDERRRREVRSRAFLARHARALRLVCALPFTRMVALSGSIAHLNLEDRGDLDLFIITRGRRVWTVTVAMIVMARLLGVRRAMCANFVMSDAHLGIEQQDLFTANQVLHLKPLFGPEVLDGFVAANPFVKRFYPNRSPRPSTDFLLPHRPVLSVCKSLLEALLRPVAPMIEALCRRLYAWHLHRKSSSWQSPEQVRLQADYLKLHTRSHRDRVLERFDERMDETLNQRAHAAIA
jgi:hypothetical protein